MTDKKAKTEDKAALPEDIGEVFDNLQFALATDPCPLGEWELGFVRDQLVRWKKFGDKMYLSQKQLDILLKIAKAQSRENV